MIFIQTPVMMKWPDKEPPRWVSWMLLTIYAVTVAVCVWVVAH